MRWLLLLALVGCTQPAPDFEPWAKPGLAQPLVDNDAFYPGEKVVIVGGANDGVEAVVERKVYLVKLNNGVLLACPESSLKRQF